MGGGITGAKGDTEQNEQLQQFAEQYYNLAKPLFDQAQGGVANILNKGPQQFTSLTPDFQRALQSGASTAYEPAINRSSEAAFRAGSQATQQTREDATRQNITGSDYERLLGNSLQQQFFNASQAPAPFYKAQADAASQYGYGQAGADQGFYRDIVSTFYKALGIAPQVSLGALGTSASNATQINTANTAGGTAFANNLQTLGGATQGSGGGVSSAVVAGCWIAAKLYGRCSPEFYYTRYWLMEGWHGPFARLTRKLYHRYGERLAQHPRIVTLLKPFFDWAMRKGRGAWYGE